MFIFVFTDLKKNDIPSVCISKSVNTENTTFTVFIQTLISLSLSGDKVFTDNG